MTQFVQGNPVTNAHPAIQMFSICSNMKWAHLPVEGGIYAQDPELLRLWGIIWQKQAEHEAAEERKREAQRKASARKR